MTHSTNMLRLACADFTFPLLLHDQSLELIRMLGMDGVDIGLFEGRSHRQPSHELFDGSAAQSLRQRTADLGLEIADVFLQMASDFRLYAINHYDASRRQKARDWFLRTLDYAAVCGSTHVTILPGVTFDHEPPEVSFGRCSDELEWRIDQSNRAGLTLGVEAHLGSIAPTPEETLRLVKATPDLTLTLDYTHFTRNGTLDHEIEPLLAHASHFHVRGARPGRLQCSFNENTIDYARIGQMMQKNGYAGYLGIEYVWIDWEHCNEVDNLSEAILFRNFLRTAPQERWACSKPMVYGDG